MKKLLAISLIVAATFAGVSTASASMYSGNYTGWAIDAINSGGQD